MTRLLPHRKVVRFVFPLLALCAVSCGHQTATHRRGTVSLVQEYAFARQVNFVKQRGDAFHPDLGTLRMKRVPSLVQDQPGSISFYLQLQNQPVLHLDLDFFSRTSSDLNAGIRVVADSPKALEREYPIRSGEELRLDLREFDHRVVEITLYARSRNLQRLGGQVFWLNPTIEQSMGRVADTSPDMTEFRVRHRGNNVLIFLFDATNASHLGCYGYSRSTSAAIDAVAAQGIVFEDAMTQAASTLASTGSLFTGVYPEAHGVLVKPHALSPHFKTLAEQFQEAQYQTALFSGNPNASPIFGYGQGFQYTWVPRPGRPVNADEFVPAVTTWLEKVKQRPFFAYLHFREPHWPYTPPAEFMMRFHPDPDLHLPDFQNYGVPEQPVLDKVLAAYDANLAFADAQMARIVQHLKKLNLWDHTMIIVLADHGEGFWEHGKQGHNYPLYQEIVRIPMIFRFPEESRLQGARSKQLAASIDVLPTLMDLFGFSKKGTPHHGRSLLSALVDPTSPAEERFVLSQSIYKRMYVVRSARFKFIYHEKEKEIENEFYSLATDPQERTNLIDRFPVLSSYHAVQMKKILDEARRIRKQTATVPEENAVVDEQTEQELRALGYVN